jgi:site-specific DNA recombinase
LFAAVATQLTENRQRGRESRRGAKYLLQGLLECKCCGYAFYGKPVSRKSKIGKVPYAYYRCIGSDAYRFGGTRICENKQVRTDKLEEAVWQDACELLRHPKLLRAEYERRLAAPTDSASQSSLKKQLKTAQQSVARLIDAFSDGVLDRCEFDPRLKRARERTEALKQQLESFETQSREQATLREALACLDDFTASIGINLDQADWVMKREILRRPWQKLRSSELAVRLRARTDSFRIRISRNIAIGLAKSVDRVRCGETSTDLLR